MTIKELINQLSKFNSNDKVFVNTTSGKHYEISIINVGCDADYNDVYIVVDDEIEDN